MLHKHSIQGDPWQLAHRVSDRPPTPTQHPKNLT
jgi:hypothetical protein